MTRRIKIWLIALCTALCACCAFAGCSIGKESLEDILSRYNCNVTYYGNGGDFNGSKSIFVKDIYFNCGDEGQPFFDIGVSGETYIQRSGYDLVGWFLPARYEDGEHEGEVMYTYIPEGETEAVPVYPVTDENGDVVTDTSGRRPLFAREGVDEEILESEVVVVPSETQVTSEYILNAGDDIIVCADWVLSAQLEYILVCDEDLVLTDGEKEYRNGDVIKSVTFIGNSMSPSPSEPLKLEGGTFVSTYLDPECTQQINPIQRPEEGNAQAYSWYIAGEWTLVTSDKSSVADMFAGMYDEDAAFYVLEDIDCSDMGTFSLNTASDLFSTKATIQGNGHTISNITFSQQTQTGLIYSIFGTVAAQANITDLTLDGVTIKITARTSDVSAYALASSVDAAAKIDNLVINDVTMSISANGNKINNIKYDEESGQTVVSGGWLFGGVASDEELLEQFAGKLTVTGENTVEMAV